VFRNRGDGTVDSRHVHDLTAAWSSMSLADVDHDGRFDLVLVGAAGIVTLLGNGDGTFTEVSASGGPGGSSIALADWNADGDLDAVVSGGASWLYTGDGLGGWQFASGVALGTGTPGDVRVTDLDLDGRPDVVALSFREGASGIAFLRDQDSVDPEVDLVAPNGGETLVAGRDYEVHWTASDDVSVTAIDLLLLRRGARGPVETIARGLAPTGSFAWRVTSPASDSALVRVLAHDEAGNTGRDRSAGSFRIDHAVATQLERFTAEPAGAGVVIRWRFAREVGAGAVRLERSVEDAEVWNVVSAPREADDGGWRVHDREGGDGPRRYRLVVEGGGVFGPIEARAGAPLTLGFRQSSPSPASGLVRFEVALPREVRLGLVVLDVQGRTVARIAQGVFPAGIHEVEWRATPSSPGLYFARLTSEAGTRLRRVILTR
jgi:hypothetical protein